MTERSVKQDSGTNLFGDGLLGLEKGIESSGLDGLKKSSGDVHVRIKRVLSSGEFRKEGDGRLEVARVGSEVAADDQGGGVSEFSHGRCPSARKRLASG